MTAFADVQLYSILQHEFLFAGFAPSASATSNIVSC